MEYGMIVFGKKKDEGYNKLVDQYNALYNVFVEKHNSLIDWRDQRPNYLECSYSKRWHDGMEDEVNAAERACKDVVVQIDEYRAIKNL
jgi:hypothetical protein